jgi:hypothetical protein
VLRPGLDALPLGVITLREPVDVQGGGVLVSGARGVSAGRPGATVLASALRRFRAEYERAVAQGVEPGA